MTTRKIESPRSAQAEREQKIIDAASDWLESLLDMIALSSDAMWKESTARPDIPQWVRAANARLDATFFAPITSTLNELKLTPYRAGYACGMMKWTDRSLTLSPELEALARTRKLSTRTNRRLGKLFESFLIRGSFLTKAELKRSQYIPPKTQRYIDTIENRSTGEIAEFHEG